MYLTYNRTALSAMQRTGLKMLPSSDSIFRFLHNFREEMFYFCASISLQGHLEEVRDLNKIW